eukprot:TRINITY_DN7250_c0_g1_i1.p1 TRINITY_DN7250_c0_g1~~TRINITY_DN7250_c0_g1_i1.p1  ORF type:complete len:104 (+),score=0.84 TRINITY_DN7250_c0_g1_i1:26-313(+)
MNSKTTILSLYRKILREGQRMPTPNRRKYVYNKAYKEFRVSAKLVDSVEIEERIVFAQDMYENIRAQRRHLNKILAWEEDTPTIDRKKTDPNSIF